MIHQLTQAQIIEGRMAMAVVEALRDDIDPMQWSSASYDLANKFASRMAELEFLPDIGMDDEGAFSFDWYVNKDNQTSLVFSTDSKIVYVIIFEGVVQKGICPIPGNLHPALYQFIPPPERQID